MAIASGTKKNFFAAHYELVVVAVGALALAGGIVAAVMSGENTDAIEGNTPSVSPIAESGVEPASMNGFSLITLMTTQPNLLDATTTAARLGSEARVHCALCAAPIPVGVKVCTFCKGEQPEDKPKEVVEEKTDKDEDGILDSWEVQYGLNPDDAGDAAVDTDGDLYTNLEEFTAGTDPSDPASHPEYIDSLWLKPPFKETTLAFYLNTAMAIPSGYRLEFRDAKGRTARVLKGEEISMPVVDAKGKSKLVPTGFKLADYELREVVRDIKVTSTQTKQVVEKKCFAKVQRVSDGKEIELEVGDRKLKPVDIQATLVFRRLQDKEYVVIPGETIDLNGEKWLVKSIKTEAGKDIVFMTAVDSDKKKLLKPLE